MLRKGIYGLVAVLGVVALAWAGDATKENVWVSDDMHVHALHESGRAMFISEDSITFDLADLAEGESRVFGTGDKQITVAREGDVATISRVERGEASGLDITCLLGSDSCEVVTPADDDNQVMIMVRKTRRCENGEGDCAEVDVEIQGHGGHLAHGEALIEIMDLDGEPREGLAEIILQRAGDGNVFRLHSGEVTLRCPEGDARMHVESKEADDVFLCPKHSVPLERVEPTIRHIEIKHPRADDDD